jgi:hypothetical protein
MNVRYRVELSQAERGELTAMLSKGERAARKLKRAQILLAADAGRSDEEIARAVAVGGSHRVPDQAAFCGRQSGTGAERGIRVLERSASSPARKKPCWWQRLAQTLPRVAPTGRWNCWPTPYARQPVDDSAVSAMFAGKWHAAEWRILPGLHRIYRSEQRAAAQQDSAIRQIGEHLRGTKGSTLHN